MTAQPHLDPLIERRIERRTFLSGLAISAIMLPSCSDIGAAQQSDLAPPVTDKAAKLVASARSQIGVTVYYDPAYTGLEYPGGDVPPSRGVCTDVIIRAYRDALELDLQKLVHEDMKANFSAYPNNWQLTSPDRNIDHRRVPNLQCFLTRKGAQLPVTADPSDWQVGDIFTSKVGGRLPHIGIVSDRAADGALLAVHNIGRGTREEDVVFAHPLDGHYRWQV